MTTLALKLNTTTATAALAAKTARRAGSLRRALAHRWDLVGILTLMGSSAAYALYTLAHLG